MSNWLHDLYDTMKRSEKEMLIRRSGSTGAPVPLRRGKTRKSVPARVIFINGMEWRVRLWRFVLRIRLQGLS